VLFDLQITFTDPLGVHESEMSIGLDLDWTGTGL